MFTCNFAGWNQRAALIWKQSLGLFRVGCNHLIHKNIIEFNCLHIVCLSKCLSETEQLPPLGSWPSVLEEATEATCVLNGFHPKGAMCGKTWQNYVQTTYKPWDMCHLDDTKTAGCFAGQASLSKRRWRQHAETDTFNNIIEAHTPFQPMPHTCSNNPKYTMGEYGWCVSNFLWYFPLKAPIQRWCLGELSTVATQGHPEDRFQALDVRPLSWAQNRQCLSGRKQGQPSLAYESKKCHRSSKFSGTYRIFVEFD